MYRNLYQKNIREIHYILMLFLNLGDGVDTKGFHYFDNMLEKLGGIFFNERLHTEMRSLD